MKRFGTRRLLGVTMVSVSLLLATACSSKGDDTNADDSGSTTTAGTTDPLGPVNKATGDTVKIGMITDGASEGINNEINGPVADATVQWLNEHQNGFGGHVIELTQCETNNDPGKAGDCANQMITDGVAAVVVPASAQVESIWSVIQPSGIPILFYGTGSEAVLQDGKTGFSLSGPSTLLVDFPLGLAQEQKVDKVTAVVIDVPAATDFYKGDNASAYEDAGVALDLVAVAPGTADMTPQMQKVVSENPDGIVTVVGNDSFCIAAFNGLRTAGFTGTIATISQCISDATVKAVPGDFLKGMKIGQNTPFPNADDPAVQQYLAVIDTYGAKDVDHSDANGMATFSTVGALGVAMADLKGDATPASVAAAFKAMKETEIPGSGGLKFRCNGKADPDVGVAVCSHSLLAGELDDKGVATTFTILNDTPIPD